MAVMKGGLNAPKAKARTHTRMHAQSTSTFTLHSGRGREPRTDEANTNLTAAPTRSCMQHKATDVQTRRLQHTCGTRTHTHTHTQAAEFCHHEVALTSSLIGEESLQVGIAGLRTHTKTHTVKGGERHKGRGRANLGGESAHEVVVNARAQRPKKVDCLAGEGVHELLDLAVAEVVLLEDALAHADAVDAGRVPVVLLHAAVADERRVQCAEVIACTHATLLTLQRHRGSTHGGMEQLWVWWHRCRESGIGRTGADDGNAGALVGTVDTGELHVGRIVGDVHEGRVDHLVVDGVLRALAEAAGAGVEVVDEDG